ncbi:hypothetical protein AKO1_011483 [Acrasis kona]|uniref:C2 domain-containing protein n=1 Tax=Acrasis kona TaxID=1008807 RepID=A0AAW2Z3V3_9EUKA
MSTLKERIDKLKFNKTSTKIEGYLNVVLESGDNLVPKDRSGKSDPYVYLATGPESDDYSTIYPKTGKSKVKKQTLSPVFDEEFSLPVASIFSDFLFIEVWDWDLVGGHDYMGSAKVNLQSIKQLCESEDKVSHQIRLKDVASGTINLKLSYVLADNNVFNALKKYIDQYDFNIISIITNHTTKNIYKDYLIKHNLSNQFSFIDQIIKYRVMGTGERQSEAEDIVSEFIEANAPQHLSIPANIKNEIIHEKDFCPQNLFDAAFDNQVNVVLSAAPLSGFLSSKPFLHAIVDNWLTLAHEIGFSKDEEVSLSNLLMANNEDESATLTKLRREVNKYACPIISWFLQILHDRMMVSSGDVIVGEDSTKRKIIQWSKTKKHKIICQKLKTIITTCSECKTNKNPSHAKFCCECGAKIAPTVIDICDDESDAITIIKDDRQHFRHIDFNAMPQNDLAENHTPTLKVKRILKPVVVEDAATNIEADTSNKTPVRNPESSREVPQTSARTNSEKDENSKVIRIKFTHDDGQDVVEEVHIKEEGKNGLFKVPDWCGSAVPTPPDVRCFSRHQISSVYHCMEQLNFDTNDTTNSFACLLSDLNPDQPAGPGQHGFALVEVKKAPPVLPVFTRCSATKWQYCGHYTTSLKGSISVNDWPHLSSTVRKTWLQALLDSVWGFKLLNILNIKKAHRKDEESLDKAFLEGLISISVVVLKCDYFDEEYYGKLVEYAEKDEGKGVTKVRKRRTLKKSRKRIKM